jgi:hypothetical protein
MIGRSDKLGFKRNVTTQIHFSETVNTMKSSAVKTAIFICCLCCVMAAASFDVAWTQSQSPAAPSSEERRRLEDLEDRSEAIANQLLELSVLVRDGETDKVAEFFSDPAMTTPLPASATDPSPKVKWVHEHGWKFEPNKTARTGRAELSKQWDAFLANFSELEDARFKLRASSFNDRLDECKATVGFYLIGRDDKGRREWTRGSAATTFVLKSLGKDTDNPQLNSEWSISEFAIMTLGSLEASTDIFSEISMPAGVAHSIPGYGEKGNTGFVWYGAAAADFNRDGWIDLFVTAADRNFLYLNDGAGKFRDASDETGVKLLQSGAGPLLFDYDDDGDTDVFIANVGQQVLLENRLVPDRKLAFRDVSLEAGVAVNAFGFSAAAADVNGDGRLDVYVASYNRYGQVTPDSWFRATNGTPNLLFINWGDGTFREEARKWGVDDRRWSYAAAFADVNGDNRPDLYVANDFGEKAMFINKGDRFLDEAKERGVLDPGNGMGAAFGDYNNDGLLDLHATNMSSTAGNRILARMFPNQTPKDNVYKKLAAGNNLFRNLGDGNYKDVTADVASAGGFGGGWAWGGGFIDFDNDGWEDIYTPNGFISGKSMKDT